MEWSILEVGLDSFQEHVTDCFLNLSSIHQDDLLSRKWIVKLLDCFLVCYEEFKAILYTPKGQTSQFLVCIM